jgi:D-sedoheptulose 7-phosphate isomerase
MSSSAPDPIGRYLGESRVALDALSIEQIQSVIDELHQAYRDDRQVLVAGNGGSAATANHFEVDLAKTILGRPVNREARGFRTRSLVANASVITAWANDFDYDDVFAEQVETLGRAGDLLVAITGSGNSPNIVSAVEAAKRRGMRSIALLGFDGGRTKDLVDAYVLVPSDDYGHVEDMHMLVTHLVTEYFAVLVRSGRRV